MLRKELSKSRMGVEDAALRLLDNVGTATAYQQPQQQHESRCHQISGSN
jgi:hypothetical protein